MAESMASKTDPGGRPRRALGEHPPAQRVGPPGVEDLPRVDDVADALGHLAPVGVDDVAEAEHVAVGGGLPHQGVDGQQRVEPAPGLVDGLADEVGRVDEASRPSPAHRIAPLGRGHGAGVEPGVDDRLHPSHRRDPGPRTRGRRRSPRRCRAGGGRPSRRRARPAPTARPTSRRSARVPRRTARPEGACPRSGRGTGPSPRCWPATPPSARPGCARGASRWSGSGPPARPCGPRCGRTSWACPSR